MERVKWPQPLTELSVALAQPEIGALERSAMLDVFDSRIIGAISPVVQEVENTLTSIMGKKSRLVSNGSVALILALKACGIKSGDKVITSSLTYAATASSIIHVGATPVFCEIEKDSWQISIDSIARMYSRECRAILVPHIYGVPANMDVIMEFADKHGLIVIEDCAETIFGEYSGQKVGTFGHAGTFSFFPNKLITCGEGGAVCVRDEIHFQRLSLLRGQGMDPERRYWFLEPGFNFRITGIQAAMLSAQLSRRFELWENRESSENQYREVLRDFVTWPEAKYRFKRSPWIFSGILKDKSENQKLSIARQLASLGIETRPVFYPLPEMPAFRNYASDDIPIAKQVSQNGISLPTGIHVEEYHIELIRKVLVKD